LAVLAASTVRSDTVLPHLRSRLKPRAWVSVGSRMQSTRDV
jgi:hypothetical protein